MAPAIVWSRTVLKDLRDIVRYISRDSPRRANLFASRLMTEADMLQAFPEIGHFVPEHRDRQLRQLLVSPYRIVYRVDHRLAQVQIVRVWHSARGNVELN